MLNNCIFFITWIPFKHLTLARVAVRVLAAGRQRNSGEQRKHCNRKHRIVFKHRAQSTFILTFLTLRAKKKWNLADYFLSADIEAFKTSTIQIFVVEI